MCKLKQLEQAIKKLIDDEKLNVNTIIGAINTAGYDYRTVNDDSLVLTLQDTIIKGRGVLKGYEMPEYRGQDTKPISLSVKSEVFNIDNWSIAHFTKKPFEGIIKSSLRIRMENGDNAHNHTNTSDWINLGNMGNIFFLLCYKGVPLGEHQFLKGSKFYVSFPLKDIQTLWISNDWITEGRGEVKKEGQTQTTERIIYGNGINVFNTLLRKIDLTNLANFISDKTNSDYVQDYAKIIREKFDKSLSNEDAMYLQIIESLYPTLEVKLPYFDQKVLISNFIEMKTK